MFMQLVGGVMAIKKSSSNMRRGPFASFVLGQKFLDFSYFVRRAIRLFFNKKQGKPDFPTGPISD